VTIIDTFPDFETYWSNYHDSTPKHLLDGWVNEYMVKWPDLLETQTKQYRDEGVDWKNLAKARIMPHLKRRLPKMRLARQRLLDEIQDVLWGASAQLKINLSVYAVIYVGIGLGAGWATKYRSKPALLFGVENIAEEGWTSTNEIRGLITHEFAHLLHTFWRLRSGKSFISSPLWQLYTEGFADRFEISIGSKNKSHRESTNRGPAWFQHNKQWLATEFLSRLQNNASFKEFFGSWYQLRGHSQTGYYLGSEIIRNLENTYTLKEIATLDDVSRRMKRELYTIAQGKK
jgi:hypothetical protein